MGALLGLTNGLGVVNAALLTLGRRLGAGMVGLMVIIILLQVFFRYVLDNALAWPEEAARFLMLWMTGLMAPTAFRRGGFVSIEMLTRLLPTRMAALLSLLLLGLSLVLLLVGLQIGWSEVTGLGGRFTTDSLHFPTTWDLSIWDKVPKSWMMLSLVVGLGLLISVCAELMLRNIATLAGRGDRLIEIPHAVMGGAE
ncbi:TRAP transporter small permease [Pseudorhodobacter sp. E13]|uniref:TRAP transporter small permease n=1 Tax=Pseudorhodobacter sp. E13 TaxID=2487931 RepID=UPI000F8F423C|nr:TRAP transporter small permease [Pseudorhodobacter sp. E13]RUS58953.1 TRAP transporter small permease [Pseudorhodobacter sp. E13]